MTIPPGTLTARAGVEGNYLDAISEMALRLREAASDELTPAMLADITPVVGTVQDITIVAPESFAQDLKFVTEDGVLLAAIDAGWVDNDLSGAALKAYARSVDEKGYLALVASNSDGTVQNNVQLRHDGLFSIRGLPIKFGVQDTYRKVADSAEQAVSFCTIPANSMGPNGRAGQVVTVVIKNNKGTNGAVTFTFYFGSKSVTVVSGQTINNSATTRHVYRFLIEVANAGAANAQIITIAWSYLTDTAAEVFGSGAAATNRLAWTTAAVDTSAAVDMKLNVTLSATHASFFTESSGEFSGAYAEYT